MKEFESEWAKMFSGEIYNAVHPEFLSRLVVTRGKIKRFNDADPSDVGALMALFRDVVPDCGEDIHVNQPFRCDYGCNIKIGNHVFINFNFTVLDEAEVRIGNNVFIGPNVSIYTACHPLCADERNTGAEWAEPVTIGNSVWIGGGVTILSGVTIGEGAVIGAGSVVTHNVEPFTVAAGNPALTIRKI